MVPYMITFVTARLSSFRPSNEKWQPAVAGQSGISHYCETGVGPGRTGVDSSLGQSNQVVVRSTIW